MRGLPIFFGLLGLFLGRSGGASAAALGLGKEHVGLGDGDVDPSLEEEAFALTVFENDLTNINIRHKTADNHVLIEGDMVTEQERTPDQQHRTPDCTTWPADSNGYYQVPFTIGKGYSVMDLDNMQWVFDYFAYFTHIRFVPRAKHHKSFIDIQSRDGCWSHHGRKADGSQLLSLAAGDCTSKKIIAHELLHALCIEHEHTRSGRGWKVRFSRHDTCEKYREFLEWKKYKEDSNYDYASITHFRPDAYSCTPGKLTLMPDKPEAFDLIEASKIVLSSCDLHDLHGLYGGGQRPKCKAGVLPDVCTPTEACTAKLKPDVCKDRCLRHCEFMMPPYQPEALCSIRSFDEMADVYGLPKNQAFQSVLTESSKGEAVLTTTSEVGERVETEARVVETKPVSVEVATERPPDTLVEALEVPAKPVAAEVARESSDTPPEEVKAAAQPEVVEVATERPRTTTQATGAPTKPVVQAATKRPARPDFHQPPREPKEGPRSLQDALDNMLEAINAALGAVEEGGYEAAGSAVENLRDKMDGIVASVSGEYRTLLAYWKEKFETKLVAEAEKQKNERPPGQ